MTINYNSNNDLLYLRFDPNPQSIINRRITDDIVLDIGENDKIIGIEIMDASKHLNLENMMPVEFLKAI